VLRVLRGLRFNCGRLTFDAAEPREGLNPLKPLDGWRGHKPFSRKPLHKKRTAQKQKTLGVNQPGCPGTKRSGTDDKGQITSQKQRVRALLTGTRSHY